MISLKSMFKKFFLMAIFSVMLLGSFNYLSAQDTASEMERQLQAAGEKGAGFAAPVDPRDTVFLIIRYALGLLGFVFLLLTLYAGFLWMTAGGDESKIETAKKILTASVIGLAIILLSYGFTVLILKILTLQDAPFRRWP